MSVDDVIDSLHEMSREVDLLCQLKDNITKYYNLSFRRVDTNMSLGMNPEQRIAFNFVDNFNLKKGVDKVDVVSSKIYQTSILKVLLQKDGGYSLESEENQGSKLKSVKEEDSQEGVSPNERRHEKSRSAME